MLFATLLIWRVTRGITSPVRQAAAAARRLADGDLTVKVQSKSKDETGQMLQAMGQMVEKLSGMIGTNVSASQVLAEGASEQASALEQTSASLEELASMTRQNANNAQQANELTQGATQIVSRASASMGQLTHAMDRITAASDQMAKIIKTIDEIAFQTNLLALNAAVEAARAGEAGAGFAVVAEEVRNLARRAAEAAKNTGELIEANLKNIGEGSKLVAATGDNFGEVAGVVEKVAGLVGEIAAASGEQTQGIDQINKAIVEMDKVTQNTAANAEEMAAAMAMFKIR